MRRLLASLPLLLGLALVGCSSDDPDKANEPTPVVPEGPKAARSELARAEASTVPEATLEAAALANNDFAFDLYEQLREGEEGKNIVFSPISVSLALSMTYAGAQNTTKSEMANALRFDPSLDIHAGHNALSQALESRAKEALSASTKLSEQSGLEAPSADDYRLHIVNSIWAEESYPWEEPFLDTLAQNYGAGVYLADFLGQPDSERQRINGWVSDETKEKINDLLPEGVIDALTRLVLVNAIHLKMPWASPFHTSFTKAGSFTKADGATVSADFMSQQEGFRYFEDEHAQIAALPLAGKELSFVVALPKGPLDAYEELLDRARWKAIWATMQHQEVAITLPKFTFTTDSLSLADAFKALGMVEAFDSGAADFYGMCKEPPNGERLYVTEIAHKAMMAIDEAGVEAAAATAVVIGTESAAPEAVEMKVDRPFLVAIVDEPTSSLLFLGRIHDPTAK